MTSLVNLSSVFRKGTTKRDLTRKEKKRKTDKATQTASISPHPPGRPHPPLQHLPKSPLKHNPKLPPLYLHQRRNRANDPRPSQGSAKRGITVNTISPDPTGTDAFYDGKNEKLLQTIASWSPNGRIGTPEEVAQVVVAGPQSAWIDGQNFRVNGGYDCLSGYWLV